MRLDRLQEQLRDWIRAHGNSLRLEHRFEQPNPNANKASQGKKIATLVGLALALSPIASAGLSLLNQVLDLRR